MNTKPRSLDFCRSVSEICAPFFKASGINYLGYGRAYKDGSLVDISSDGNWVEHFINENYAGIGFTGKPVSKGYYTHTSGLGKLMPTCQFDIARESFDMHSPLVIVNTFEDHYEYFLMTTSRENREIYDYYLNNKELVEKFTQYFKRESAPVLKKIGKRSGKIPDKFSDTFTIEQQVADENKKELLSILEPKNYSFNIHGSVVTLSAKQFDFAKQYVSGVSAKEIANKRNVSVRTAEYYLQLAREKLSCHSKSELRQLLASQADI